MNQAALPVFAECERQGIAVHNAAIFASGLLAGGVTYLYREASEELVMRTTRWKLLAEKHNVSLPAVAVAFASLPKCVSKVVIGLNRFVIFIYSSISCNAAHTLLLGWIIQKFQIVRVICDMQ